MKNVSSLSIGQYFEIVFTDKVHICQVLPLLSFCAMVDLAHTMVTGRLSD